MEIVTIDRFALATLIDSLIACPYDQRNTWEVAARLMRLAGWKDRARMGQYIADHMPKFEEWDDDTEKTPTVTNVTQVPCEEYAL